MLSDLDVYINTSTQTLYNVVWIHLGSNLWVAFKADGRVVFARAREWSDPKSWPPNWLRVL